MVNTKNKNINTTAYFFYGFLYNRYSYFFHNIRAIFITKYDSLYSEIIFSLYKYINIKWKPSKFYEELMHKKVLWG